MTWARQGCLVLVIDQVGHGERAQHPFQGTDDYRKKNSGYKWWRQDYYYRFDTNVQLELVGQSLMGWMVWDLMRGVDLLLARPGIDQKKIILLGAVAGGGDPAAVTAALDRRIACVVPFNFGGPQPETRYPLPDDADLYFNYLGGAYWESTRNLRRTGSDSFFAWSIVASVIPRRLVYAHEFSWDRKRDPVWKRLNRLYEFYGEPGNIDYTVGRGSVKGRPPESTHCTNIGRHHRQRIHAAFDRWFNIKVTQDDEYTQPRRPEELRSMTEHARSELKPRRPFELLAEIGHEQVAAVRRQMTGQSATARLRQVRQAWQQRLGDIVPRKNMHVLSETAGTIAGSRITVHRIALQTEPGIVVPMILLSPEQAGDSPLRTVVAVSQSGRREFLRTRSREIASLLEGGAAVCLPDMRDVGTDRGSRGEGSNGSISYYALLFETPMLGYRLRDLRSVLRYLRTRNGPEAEFALWGDSFAQPNPADTDFQVPKRVSGRPGFSEPLGGLLALLAAVYEDEIKVVYVHGGLSSYQDVLAGPYVYVPHDAIVPGVLLSGDIADLAASLAPRPLKLEGTVDALNRRLSPDALRTTYEPVTRTYAAENADSASYSTDRSNPAGWILKSLER